MKGSASEHQHKPLGAPPVPLVGFDCAFESFRGELMLRLNFRLRGELLHPLEKVVIEIRAG